jgi:hypothetical protein
MASLVEHFEYKQSKVLDDKFELLDAHLGNIVSSRTIAMSFRHGYDDTPPDISGFWRFLDSCRDPQVRCMILSEMDREQRLMNSRHDQSLYDSLVGAKDRVRTYLLGKGYALAFSQHFEYMLGRIIFVIDGKVRNDTPSYLTLSRANSFSCR